MVSITTLFAFSIMSDFFAMRWFLNALKLLIQVESFVTIFTNFLASIYPRIIPFFIGVNIPIFSTIVILDTLSILNTISSNTFSAFSIYVSSLTLIWQRKTSIVASKVILTFTCFTDFLTSVYPF